MPKTKKEIKWVLVFNKKDIEKIFNNFKKKSKTKG